MNFVKVFFSPTRDFIVCADTRAECAAHVVLQDAAGNIVPMVQVDVGAVVVDEPVALDGKPCSIADHVSQRLEMHPHAADHPDAPLIRFKPGHEPDVHHWCPTGLDAVKAHLRERGAEGLHGDVINVLREQCLHREDFGPSDLRNLGLSLAQIKAVPRVAAKIAALKVKMNEPLEEAAEAARAAEAERAAAIDKQRVIQQNIAATQARRAAQGKI